MFEVTLQDNEEFSMFIFDLWFYYVQSLTAFDTRCILSTPASEVHVRLKTTGTERNTSIAGPREELRWNGKIRQ